MREVIIETDAMIRFDSAVDEVAGADRMLSGFVLAYGQAGRGKSVAADRYHYQRGGAYVRVWQGWSQTAFLQRLLFEVRGKNMDMPRHTGNRCKELVVQLLEAEPKPIFIDEADRLRIDRIEDLRDIHEMTGAPVVLIGEEGADEETDAQLRERYALQWQASNGCTKYAYMAWALSVPGVTSVSILDQHPRGQGTVDIVVRGADVLPTAALLEKVRAAIAPNTPVNDDWLVKGPGAVACMIDGTIEYTTGDPDAIRAQAENRLRALFAETSPLADVTALQIGQDLTLDLLTHTVMAVPGVKRVTWASPAQDVLPVPADGVACLESLSLRTVMAEET